jgi:N6-adenosine-specific RNA methylase IME4
VEQLTVPLSDAKGRVYDGTVVQECPACDGKGEKEHCGMGRIVRGSHEICLVGVRGKAKNWVCDKSVRSAFDTIAESEIVAPVGEHSEKPDAFYRLVETLFPGPYVEIHARKPRPGWFSVGHQLGAVEPTNAGIDT